jgi:hypothetical protein
MTWGSDLERFGSGSVWIGEKLRASFGRDLEGVEET